MMAMHPPSAVFHLPIPVLFSNMEPSAARYGHRKPDPHDRPAALSFIVHGDNRRGAVVWEMYTLPSTEDRLKNGIRLSDCYHAFALLDDCIGEHFDDMSFAMSQCLDSGVKEQLFDYPDRGKDFFGPTDLPPRALRDFYMHRYAIYQEIKSLLKSGRLTAYGKEKITDEKWKIIPCHYFSLECEISFDENKVTIEELRFLDVRITCLEGLPIWCAMVSYGDQELVPRLMRLVARCRYEVSSKRYIPYLIEEIRAFRRYFSSLMKGGELKAVYLETDEQVDSALWDEKKISLARSEILIAPKLWRGAKINTPHPPLNEEDENTLAVNTSRVLIGARGYGASDALLAQEMHELILDGQAKNVHQAAKLVVTKAEGRNTRETSKVQRLMGAYNKAFPSSR